MTDITAYENRKYFKFGNSNKLNETYNLQKIIKYSIDQFISNPEYPNFSKGYLPEMKFKDVNSISDIFLKTIDKSFDIDGAQCIRFILINNKGHIYDDLNQWTQVLPNSFLARISCSYRNFDPNSLILDYFIDMNEIQLNNEDAFGGSTISFINKEIVSGYVTQDNTKIKLDERISEFNNHKMEIFLDFFKYDFGNVIKAINHKYD